jgi:hypothetical protein
MSTQSIPAPARAGQQLVGRVAFVTGRTRGIGAAICRSLASQGADIAAGYHSGARRADQLCAELEAYGVATSAHHGNIGSAQDCRRTVNEVIQPIVPISPASEEMFTIRPDPRSSMCGKAACYLSRWPSPLPARRTSGSRGRCRARSDSR